VKIFLNFFIKKNLLTFKCMPYLLDVLELPQRRGGLEGGWGGPQSRSKKWEINV
jgi:hypothetical protein